MEKQKQVQIPFGKHKSPSFLLARDFGHCHFPSVDFAASEQGKLELPVARLQSEMSKETSPCRLQGRNDWIPCYPEEKISLKRQKIQISPKLQPGSLQSSGISGDSSSKGEAELLSPAKCYLNGFALAQNHWDKQRRKGEKHLSTTQKEHSPQRLGMEDTGQGYGYQSGLRGSFYSSTIHIQEARENKEEA